MGFENDININIDKFIKQIREKSLIAEDNAIKDLILKEVLETGQFIVKEWYLEMTNPEVSSQTMNGTMTITIHSQLRLKKYEQATKSNEN